MRWGQKPDGVCLVVGSCGRGFPEEKNKGGDVIFTNTAATTQGASPMQYFWEVSSLQTIRCFSFGLVCRHEPHFDYTLILGTNRIRILYSIRFWASFATLG